MVLLVPDSGTFYFFNNIISGTKPAVVDELVVSSWANIEMSYRYFNVTVGGIA